MSLAVVSHVRRRARAALLGRRFALELHALASAAEWCGTEPAHCGPRQCTCSPSVFLGVLWQRAPACGCSSPARLFCAPVEWACSTCYSPSTFPPHMHGAGAPLPAAACAGCRAAAGCCASSRKSSCPPCPPSLSRLRARGLRPGAAAGAQDCSEKVDQNLDQRPIKVAQAREGK